MPIEAPIASNAKKDILPTAVFAIRSSDHFLKAFGAYLFHTKLLYIKC